MGDARLLEVGEVVALRSGGPAMTVDFVESGDGGDAVVNASWFDGDELHREMFLATALVRLW